jgi:hypothetical protein
MLSVLYEALQPSVQDVDWKRCTHYENIMRAVNLKVLLLYVHLPIYSFSHSPQHGIRELMVYSTLP